MIEQPYYSGHDWCPVALSRFVRRRGPAVVVNAVGASWSRDAGEVSRDNVVWPTRLAQACALAGSVEAILHIGSSLEYGDTAPGVPIGESSPLAPGTDYGRSKACGASRLVRAAARTATPITLIRAFNVIGPGHGTEGIWSTAVGLYRTAATGGAERVVANVPFPQTARDLVDVRDVAALIGLSARHRDAPVSIYNAASGTATTIGQLFDAFAEQTGIPYEFARIPDSVRTGSKWQCADISRAAAQLGWRPRITLTDSISAALAPDDRPHHGYLENYVQHDIEAGHAAGRAGRLG